MSPITILLVNKTNLLSNYKSRYSVPSSKWCDISLYMLYKEKNLKECVFIVRGQRSIECTKTQPPYKILSIYVVIPKWNKVLSMIKFSYERTRLFQGGSLHVLSVICKVVFLF